MLGQVIAKHNQITYNYDSPPEFRRTRLNIVHPSIKCYRISRNGERGWGRDRVGEWKVRTSQGEAGKGMTQAETTILGGVVEPGLLWRETRSRLRIAKCSSVLTLSGEYSIQVVNSRQPGCDPRA